MTSLLRNGVRLAAAACVVLLHACATPPVTDTTLPSDQAWALHQATASAVQGFSLRGRINDATSGRTANLRWEQSADGKFALSLSGPFGVGAVDIEGDTSGVVIRTKDGEQYQPDPQLWMWMNLGWSIPIDHLRNWALGLPAAGTPSDFSLDDSGHLATLQQNGWRIRYDSYVSVGTLQLPRKLEALADPTRLRLVVDEWINLDFGPDDRS